MSGRPLVARSAVPVTDSASRKLVAQFYAQSVPAPADDPFRRPVDEQDQDGDEEWPLGG